MKEKSFDMKGLPCLLQKMKLLGGYKSEKVVRIISYAMREMVMKVCE